jgi:hypothetical protein
MLGDTKLGQIRDTKIVADKAYNNLVSTMFYAALCDSLTIKEKSKKSHQ